MIRRIFPRIVLACWIGLLVCPATGVSAERGPRRPRLNTDHLKNAPQVKAALKEAVAGATAATVRVLGDGKPVALGTIVAADGCILTKASLLAGQLKCRLADGRELEARLAGRDERCDLALLRVAAEGLPAITWQAGPVPPPGTFVVATGPGDGPLTIGVISDQPQEIPGSPRSDRQRAWLGIALGEEDSSVQIQGVTPDSAAARARLQAGDRILRIDGTEMKSRPQIVETIGKSAPGRTVKLIVQRREKELELSATLGSMPNDQLPQDNWGGGPFSERRRGFPRVIPHDLVIAPSDCGGPLVDIDGRAVGLNIARALRVTSYALPADLVRESLAKLLRDEPKSPEGNVTPIE